MARYSIGIDLGTTNCALAAVEMVKRKHDVLPVPIEQLVAPGEVATRPLLPSFLYLPSDHELPAGAMVLPWDAERKYLVGEAARNWGAKVAGRLVTSAKSWLCHDGVDRQAAILPWGGPADVPKVSAVDASTRYLQHLAQAWNHSQRNEKTPARFEEQQITLTVPASFDDVARQLTAEAARRAGFLHVTLLEEPQAAFYAWIAQAERDRRRKQPLEEGMTCLVADVGGGTTDFSLIDCVAEDGSLGFVRRAVGDHLLLGGDNMDLALAHRMEEKLGTGQLDAGRFAQLVQACRAAKETLLSEGGPSECPVTVVGRGRSVVGAALTTTLTRREVEEHILDGFFPLVPSDSEPQRAKSAGIHEMGLPFVSDAAITRHLASFLRQHEVTPEKPPAAILFNGGVFTPTILRERFLAVMKQWFGSEWEPLVLNTPSLDLAVAIGAAYFGRQREYGGRAIAGGLARSYYIAIADAGDTATSHQMLCVVPQHMEEGSTIDLEKPVLELSLGQPVQFPLYTSTVRGKDKAGKLLSIPDKHLLKLAPLQTVLRGGKRAGVKGVPVMLTSTLTPVGTLELSLVAQNSPQRWRLEFNTRAVAGSAAEPASDETETVSHLDQPPEQSFPEDRIESALSVMREVYSHANEDAARQLTKEWEQRLEASRRDWPSSLCRRLADGLIEIAEQRRRSLPHLSRWYNLTGYCLRPGYGDSRDRFRVEQLWKLLCAPGKTSEGGADFWILWRRLSGGLTPNWQMTLLDRLRPVLLAGKSAIKPNNNELAEMWRAAASLERLEPKVKGLLAEPLLKQYRRPPVAHYAPWALARLGSRAMLYAPINHVVSAEMVSPWIEQLLPYQPVHESDRRSWQWTLTTMSRRIGVRGLDIDEGLRTTVLATLKQYHAPERYLHLVAELSTLEREEEQQMFGDELPLGLKVMATG
ncbi:MAG: Hsp70 family protein [Gemmatales bacterium]